MQLKLKENTKDTHQEILQLFLIIKGNKKKKNKERKKEKLKEVITIKK